MKPSGAELKTSRTARADLNKINCFVRNGDALSERIHILFLFASFSDKYRRGGSPEQSGHPTARVNLVTAIKLYKFLYIFLL
jgi:hypothetical protein